MSAVGDALRETDDTAFAIAMSNLVFARCEAVGFAALLNSSGDTALQTVAALERLGAAHTAGLVRRAVSVFPGTRPSADRDAREKQMGALPESASALWSELDRAFLEYRDNLTALERQYVTARQADFK